MLEQYSFKNIIDKKDDFFKEKTFKEFKSLIEGVEKILLIEQEVGKDKLGRNIKEITKGLFAEDYFVEAGIVYLPPKGKAIFVGDTHGDSESTLAILKQTDFEKRIGEKPDLKIVFLGDYADRGEADVENLFLTMSLKKKYPLNVVLLRGNHEDCQVYPHTLPGSLERDYGREKGRELYQGCLSFFEKMPNILLCGNGLVAVHGGIPNYDIKDLFDLKGNDEFFEQIRWNDPVNLDIDRHLWNRGSPEFSKFGKIAFEKFMKAVEGSVMIRGHQVIEGDATLIFNDRLLTIFSTGGSSQETGYPQFSSPIFAEFDLSKPITRISQENIRKIKY